MNAPFVLSTENPESSPRTGIPRMRFLAGDALIAGATLALYARLPGVLRQVAVLYDGRIRYWVEARAPSGELAFSEMRLVRAKPPGA